MMKISLKLPLILLIFSLFFHAHALDFTAVTNPLADAFLPLAGQNGGSNSFESLTIPTGGKAEGLGSAYSGLADDIGFFDFNAAASSVLENSELALFHNAWIADSALETLAGTMRLGNLGLGSQLKIFYLPFTEFNSFGDRVAANYYSETSLALNVSYNFFPGYKFKGLAVGTNLKAAWRNMPDYTDASTGAIVPRSGLAQSGLGLMADVGVMMRFNVLKKFISREPNFFVGLSVTNLGSALTNFRGEGGVKMDDPLPTAASLGFSWHAVKFFTWTAEFRQPFDLTNIKAYQMWSVSTGFLFDITNFFSLMTGFQVKNANPKITLGSEFEIRKIRFNATYTLDLTSSLAQINRFSLAAKINLGDLGRGKRQREIDRLYAEGLGHYSLGDLDKAIEVWQEALRLDKYFDPVKDAIKSAEAQKSFYQNIIDMQRLD